MLFMATHIDTRETGSITDDAHQVALRQVLSDAGKNGVVIHGVYVSESGRTVYFLYEANNADQVAAVFDPIRVFGRMESVPVINRLEL